MNLKKQIRWMIVFLLIAFVLSGCGGKSYTAIAFGDIHACAVGSDGGVICWGSNDSGQLGNGTITDSIKPVIVTGLGSVVGIAAGQSHNCAFTNTGAVKCWGSNANGQLGDGTTTDHNTPVDVTGLTGGITAIAAGRDFTCALTASGGVKCWGGNRDSQLGDGTTTDRSTPVDVSGLSGGITSISAGETYVCALTGSGNVECWGGFAFPLRDTPSDTATPLDVSGLSGVKAIAAGSQFVCVVTSGSGGQCWGGNHWGELGDGITMTDSTTPVDVIGLNGGISKIAAGGSTACAVTSAGGVKCWGSNLQGQLGDGTTTDSNTPVDVRELSSGVTAVAVGGEGACALTSSGAIKCWGTSKNWYSTTPQPLP